MITVKWYNSAEAFAKGVDKQDGLGWSLLNWQMVAQGGSNDVLIVAVFRGRG